ncbi:hypothetical protein N3K66_006932 [Trichothecium roseum]|uniref:Uncharacterized protein n=1 Tax=Trichothecium roseum TaxID=47278 RepID=A0ACC0UWS3_9HYPO|nr:hypothetical protein N3K66_006932 [Trichothecium roseum]
MAPVSNVHTRSHSLLLLQKLLNLRDGASPLTLLLDNLEQPCHAVVSEFITRAKISKAKVVFLSFATLKRPDDVDVFVKAAGKGLEAVREEVVAQYPPAFAPGAATKDSLNSLASRAPQSLAAFLSGVLAPHASLVAAYHTDVPVALPRTWNEYEPHPFAVLCHLATAVLRLSGLRQEAARKAARDRSLAEPEWGLKEGREGVLVGLRGGTGVGTGEGESGGDGATTVVLEMELRRRSGRTTSEKFTLKTASAKGATGEVRLLSDHPAFAAAAASTAAADGGGAGEYGGDGEEDEEPSSTFNLGLTEKQRRDREGVVLPYFDAQSDIGGGEGGRILYEMGREDDFDDEEDEI